MSTLMQLKRIGVVSPSTYLHIYIIIYYIIISFSLFQVEGWISRQAAGMCFDFMPNDPSTYVVGTEEGSLHRCSVSYNEQYLDNYEGHQGPLSKIRFSSRWPSLFLTCSADWMINLYHLQSKAPLLSMRSSSEDFTVTDICWCPGNSTVLLEEPHTALEVIFISLFIIIFVSLDIRGCECQCEAANLGLIVVKY